MEMRLESPSPLLALGLCVSQLKLRLLNKFQKAKTLNAHLAGSEK